MSEPLITIGITCYNAANTIERAIQSALAQDWPNKEIIVLDDCSQDQSRDIVRRFRQVKLIEHTVNQGPGAARQTLLEQASGEFLAFFDDDDESRLQRISTQYRRLIAFEADHGGHALCACYAAGERLYPNGYKMTLKPPGQKSVIPHGPAMAGHILYFSETDPAWDLGATPSCALMARTETFKAVGGFDPGLRRVEDLDFAVRLALAGGYFIGTNEVLFTQHATQAPDKSGTKNLQAEQQLVKKHQAYLNRENAYFHALYWPELRYYHFQKKYVHFAFLFLQLMLDAPILTIKHLLQTGPKRLAHERKMEK